EVGNRVGAWDSRQRAKAGGVSWDIHAEKSRTGDRNGCVRWTADQDVGRLCTYCRPGLGPEVDQREHCSFGGDVPHVDAETSVEFVRVALQPGELLRTAGVRTRRETLIADERKWQGELPLDGRRSCG